MLVHAAAFNLSLVMRSLFGFGTPRGLQGLAAASAALADASARNFSAFLGQIGRILGLLGPNRGCLRLSGHLLHKNTSLTRPLSFLPPAPRRATSSTAC